MPSVAAFAFMSPTKVARGMASVRIDLIQGLAAIEVHQDSRPRLDDGCWRCHGGQLVQLDRGWPGDRKMRLGGDRCQQGEQEQPDPHLPINEPCGNRSRK